MIGRLRGVVAAKLSDRVVVDVGGVGYETAVTPRALVELPGVGEEAVLHTHMHVREDQLALFGFESEDQRDLFRLLLGTSGVGPKVALAILGSLTSQELRAAVAAEDVDALTVVPGIGKRSAQKLMLELGAKLDTPAADLASGDGAPAAEVRQALENLGYSAVEIRDAMRDLPGDQAVEELLRLSLQALGKRGK